MGMKRRTIDAGTRSVRPVKSQTPSAWRRKCHSEESPGTAKVGDVSGLPSRVYPENMESTILKRTVCVPTLFSRKNAMRMTSPLRTGSGGMSVVVSSSSTG
eukprot:Amastigsp_a7720_59.p4 type:complete len:101 gc:universal Amastigsp_a7720_59:366-668(+)